MSTQLRTAENSVPMEKGVGGTLKPISVDEGNRLVSTAEALRHFRSLVRFSIDQILSQLGGTCRGAWSCPGHTSCNKHGMQYPLPGSKRAEGCHRSFSTTPGPARLLSQSGDSQNVRLEATPRPSVSHCAGENIDANLRYSGVLATMHTTRRPVNKMTMTYLHLGYK